MAEKLAIAMETQAMLLAAHLRNSPESRMRTSHTEKIWKYRSYQGGEPATMIDWKQSGKGREIYVREHEKITHRKIYFWCSFANAQAYEEHATLVLLALAHILVQKEREVGWVVDNLPSSQTASQLGTLFAKSLENLSKAEMPAPKAHKLFNHLVLIAANFSQENEAMVHAIKTYAAQGNMGLLIHLGGAFDEKANAITRTARNAQWPVLRLNPKDRADISLTHLLEKTVQATR